MRNLMNQIMLYLCKTINIYCYNYITWPLCSYEIFNELDNVLLCNTTSINHHNHIIWPL
jgi:hypothetical protein